MMRKLLVGSLLVVGLAGEFATVLAAQENEAATSAEGGAPSTPPEQSAPPTQSQPGDQQQPGAQQQQNDQSQHSAGRISIVQGDVNIKRGDTGELVAAAINAPLVVQDHLQTSNGSRAEVQLDSANLVRIAPNTDLGFAALEYHRYQVQLGAGTVIYRVLRNSTSQAEVDTPSVSLRPDRVGEYRISVLTDGTTQVTVRSGELEIYSPKGSQRLSGGRTMIVRGGQADPEFQTVSEVGQDQFDDWSRGRDRSLLASRSYQYVNSDIGGADDLDAYGSWVPSEYGQVWAPRPPVAGWTPYSYGHWVWTGYYGWSWVDYAPWGWAPFHYGSWFWNTGYSRWCWYPGAYRGSYFWRPAVVGFFGFGRGGIGIGVGFGGFGGGYGWVPLAPFELFHPWYGRGFYGGGYGYGRGGYGRGGVNIINNTNITNVYRNSRINGGVRTADYGHFGEGVGHYRTATAGQLHSASLIQGRMPVTPGRSSYQFSNRQAVANPRLASAGNRSFFQHQQTASFQRSSFTQPGGSGLGRTAGSVGHERTAVGSQNNFAAGGTRGTASNLQRGATTGQANNGWQRFGDPGRTSNSFRGNTSANRSEQSGWHHFGEPQNNGGNSTSHPRGTTTPNNGSMRSFSGSSFSNGANGASSVNRSIGQARSSDPGRSSNFGGYGNSRSTFSAPRSPAVSNSGGFRSGSSGGYGAMRSAPSFHAPASQSSGSMRSGGGGGSFHGGSSSGGGSHGGGGGHSRGR